MADLALIDRSAIQVDAAAHSLHVAAAPLPGLGLAGYHALETRANAFIADWQVALDQPATAAPPDIASREGVIEDGALAMAA